MKSQKKKTDRERERSNKCTTDPVCGSNLLKLFKTFQKMFSNLWTPPTERSQRTKAMSFCASSFVTEGEIKYCIAKLFSKGKNGNVEFQTQADF